jgi:hypothetical protein
VRSSSASVSPRLGRVLKGQRRPELRGFRQLALERGDFVGFGRLAERPGFGQLRGQAGALGFVRGLLLGLLGHRLDERLLEAARIGDVPERGQHQSMPSGAPDAAPRAMHRVTGAGQRRQVDFERPAVPDVIFSRNTSNELRSSCGSRAAIDVPRSCSSRSAPAPRRPTR